MGVPTITLTSDSGPYPAEVLCVEVRRELNRIPTAVVSIVDGSVARREFAQSNAAVFEPGRSLAIAVRDGRGVDVTLFKGLIVRHAVESQAGGAALRIELKDAAFRLTRQRKSAVFRQQTDVDTIGKLVKDAGLGVTPLPSAGTTHEEMIQFHASDWDFIVSRADALGLAVDVKDGTVSVREMELAGEPKAIGDAIELELELDGGAQWAKMTGRAWDEQELEGTEPVTADPPAVVVGNLKADSIAAKLGGGDGALVHPALLEPGELKAWANSRLARSRLALLRGRVVISGRADLAPLDVIELEGVGQRFNGKALVSGVTHVIDMGGWRTELLLGLPPEPFARQPDIADLLAGGLLPPAQGLHVGVVGAFEEDPLGQHRVKVLLSVLDPAQGAVWARMARPDAGKDRGLVFWPEPGDEVVVGFLNGDPRQAIIVGALHGSSHAPPAVAGPPSVDNPRRAIVSKGGTVICFDDDKRSVTVETPGKNRVVIDDDGASITLADQHGNTIALDAKGITLKSASDIHLDAAGKVVLKGSEVDVQ